MAAGLEQKLSTWVEEETGRRVAGLALIPGGASRRSYRVDMAEGTPLFLRVDAGEGPLSGTQFTLAREWSVRSSSHSKAWASGLCGKVHERHQWIEGAATRRLFRPCYVKMTAFTEHL